MRLTIRFLGLDLLTIEASTDDDQDNGTDRGDCTTQPIGFAPSPGDQRWESGPVLE